MEFDKKKVFKSAMIKVDEADAKFYGDSLNALWSWIDGVFKVKVSKDAIPVHDVMYQYSNQNINEKDITDNSSNASSLLKDQNKSDGKYFVCTKFR